jgi:hypothetical protein
MLSWYYAAYGNLEFTYTPFAGGESTVFVCPIGIASSYTTQLTDSNFFFTPEGYVMDGLMTHGNANIATLTCSAISGDYASYSSESTAVEMNLMYLPIPDSELAFTFCPANNGC